MLPPIPLLQLPSQTFRPTRAPDATVATAGAAAVHSSGGCGWARRGWVGVRGGARGLVVWQRSGNVAGLAVVLAGDGT